MVPLSQTQGIQDSEPVTIYRGVPSSGQQINPGDYVTTNKHLAADYAGNGHVIQMDVPAGHVLDDQNEPLGEEYIYRPDLPTSPQTQAENTEATDTANVDEYASDVREVIPEQTQREKLQSWAQQQIAAGYDPQQVTAQQISRQAHPHTPVKAVSPAVIAALAMSAASASTTTKDTSHQATPLTQ